MELLFAFTRNQGMGRQPFLGMEGLHLLQAVGAIGMAPDADGPGYGHVQRIGNCVIQPSVNWLPNGLPIKQAAFARVFPVSGYDNGPPKLGRPAQL